MPSIGSFTVGSVAADYTTLSQALGDITSPLTGDLTFTVIDSHSQTLSGAAPAAMNLAGYTLKVTSNSPPNGNPDGGNIITLAATTIPCVRMYNYISNPSGGQIIVENLNIRCTIASFASNMIFLDSLISSGSGGHVIHTVRDNILDFRNSTNAASTTPAMVLNGVGYSYRRRDFYAYNNMIIKYGNASGASYGSMYVRCSESYSVIENNVIQCRGGVNDRGFNFDADPVTAINNVAFDAGGSGGAFSYITAATGYNNMSEDATATNANWASGTGNIPSIVPADEFTSILPGDGLTYMEPKSAGQAAHGGTTVTIAGNTYGIIRTIARPHLLGVLSKYSIGGKEFPSVPAVTTHPTLQRVDENTAATFSVVATDATGYQWQKAPPSETPSFADVPLATLSSYTTPPAPSTDHQAQFRCVVTNAAGSVTSNAAYLLINGLPDPGAPPAAAPDRPNVTITSVVGNEITLTVTGAADQFRAELTSQDGTIVSYDERLTPGELVVTVPTYGVTYSLTVVAANTNSPPVWSLPGGAYSIFLPPPSVAADDQPGIGLTPTSSSAVRDAGPLGAGFAFPFRFSSMTGAPEMSYGVDHVIDGMKQILLTRITDRFIRRRFGSPIGGKLFAPDSQLGSGISAAIQAALAENEFRAEVTGVIFQRDRVNGTVFADIQFRTYRTHQSGNFVYPFTMNV